MIETVDRNGDGRISYSEFRSGAVWGGAGFFCQWSRCRKFEAAPAPSPPKKDKTKLKKILEHSKPTINTVNKISSTCAIFDRSRLITTNRKQGFFEVIEHNSLKKSKMSLLHQKPELEPGSDPGIDRNQAGSAILESCFRPTVDQAIQKAIFFTSFLMSLRNEWGLISASLCKRKSC